MLKKYFSLIQKLYDKQESGLPLALFRIVYGLVIFGEVYQLFYFRHLIFDPIPYKKLATFDITPFLIIWLISIIFIIIGLKTRLSSIVNYLFTVIVIGFTFHHGPSAMFEYHVDTELLTVGFILIFLPVNRRLSIDRLLQKLKYSTIDSVYTPKNTVSSLSYILLVLAAGLIYFDSIFYKFSSPMWLSGLGVWLPASLPWATWLDLSFILNQKYIILFLGYLTLIFQVTYIFLIWIKKIKPIFLLIGIGLHIGIFFAFPIPWFALGLIALYVGMLPAEFYQFFSKKWAKPIPNYLVFYYDKHCPLCNRLKWIVEFFDYRSNIIFKDVQTYANQELQLNNIPEQELLDNVYSVNAKGDVFSGINTYRELFKRVWIFKIFGYLLFIPPFHWLGNKMYTYTANNRIRYGCDEEHCNIILSNAKSPIDADSIKILQNLSIRDIKIFFTGTFILFLIVSQLIIIQSSLLMQHIYTKLHIDSRQQIAHFSRVYQRTIFPYTGLMAHPVFMDAHFKNRTQILALKYTNKNGVSTFLPMIRENGQVGIYNTGRLWVNYSFRTMNNIDLFIKRVPRYIYFWAAKEHIDLKNAHFEIMEKKIKVPYQWEDNLLRRNLNQPWKNIGSLGWKNNKFYSKKTDTH